MQAHRRSPFRTASITFLLLFLAASAIAAQSSAQTEQPTLSLEQSLARAVEANPELQAAAARIAAAYRRPDQAASLPDPMIGFMLRNVDFPELTIGNEMMSAAGVSFSQPLVTGGKRPARRAVAEREIDVAQARHEAIRRRLLRDVTVAYHELAFVDETLALVGDIRLLLQELQRTAQSRYSVGAALQQDVLKAQVEVSVLLERSFQLEQQRGSLATALNRLLDLPAESPVGAPMKYASPPLSDDLAALQQEAAAGSASLRELQLATAEQQAAVELAQVEDSPDVVLGGAWMYRGSLPSMWEINVGISLPIRKGQRQDLALDEALDRLRVREHERRAGARTVESLVRDAWLRVERAGRLMTLYDEAIVPQANLTFEAVLAAYRVGNVDFLNVLDATLKLLTYRTEWERQKTEFLVGLADIEEQIGRSLGASPEGAWTPRGSTTDARPLETATAATIAGGAR